MVKFSLYQRTARAELRPVTEQELEEGLDPSISVSWEDKQNGSPKKGDMVGRNPRNYHDQWLIAAEYFQNNFKRISDDRNS